MFYAQSTGTLIFGRRRRRRYTGVECSGCQPWKMCRYVSALSNHQDRSVSRDGYIRATHEVENTNRKQNIFYFFKQTNKNPLLFSKNKISSHPIHVGEGDEPNVVGGISLQRAVEVAVVGVVVAHGESAAHLLTRQLRRDVSGKPQALGGVEGDVKLLQVTGRIAFPACSLVPQPFHDQAVEAVWGQRAFLPSQFKSFHSISIFSQCFHPN